MRGAGVGLDGEVDVVTAEVEGAVRRRLRQLLLDRQADRVDAGQGQDAVAL